MTSTSSQPQFRYTQPPSKVLHLRNCPWECTDEELVELGKPFGKVVNTKCNVGPNRNQAFIEFADLNQAISMISYYSSSSDPAQLRGKTVYLQYSNRQEIVHNKTAGDVSGNVLLVTIEGVEPYDVSIDVLHLVFSAFGFVQKIATFEKTAGFQALVQFADQETASTARVTLDGRSIPSYLLPQHVNLCTLKITFSGHTDLNVKFQSHRSRDYTNPSLPVAPSAIDGSGQFSVGLDGNKQEESNVLLASIENMQYAVNVDVLHTVFSSFGTVQKIAMFENNSGTHALIQYSDTQSAIGAKQTLEGHPIYEGGYCKLHLSYSRHTDLSVKVNNDKSRDYTLPTVALLDTQPSILGQQPSSSILGQQPNPTTVHTAPVYSGVPYPQVSGPQYATEASQIQYAQVPGHQYAQMSGPQYAVDASQVIGPPQAVAGWGMAPTQPMASMYPNNMYVAPPGTVQYDMQHHMTMQMPAQNGQPPVTAMPPYGL